MNKRTKNLLIWAIFAIVVIVVVYFWVASQKSNPVLAAFAQCLTQRGAVMYGADWCSHCQQEKANFKDAWQYINYVECPANPQKCLDAGIEGYPTWIFPSTSSGQVPGKKFVGYQGLEKLSQESGCQLQ